MAGPTTNSIGARSIAEGGTGATTLEGVQYNFGLRGLGNYTIGDILYAVAVDRLTSIAAVATGKALISKGTGTAPAWGQIDVSTTIITGDLPFANLAQGTARSVLGVTGNATADFASIQGTANQVLVINSAGTALAFGQVNLASNAAVTGILPNTNLPTGVVIDRAYAEYTTNANLTTVIPADDTIPQSTEGTQILSVSITPKSTTNRVRVRFQGYGAVSAIAQITAALFNGAAGAIRAGGLTVPAADFRQPVVLEFEHVPGSTSAQTYTLRVGPNTGTLRMNGPTTARDYGGVSACTLIAEEIQT